MGTGIAGAVSPNVQLAGTDLSNYLTTGSAEPTVTPETISSQMSPYMNQYVNLALAPQLTAAQAQQAMNQQLMQGQATSAGAFGDPRANLLQSNQQLVNDLSNQGLIGNAYNAAFNTAIGAGAQDVANNLNAQTTNANLYNTGMTNELAGSQAALNQGTSATNLLNTLGAQQTAQSQANLNAEYNQWLMAQQYPFQTTQLEDQALTAGSVGAPITQTGTTSQPNNAGYGILGSLIGAGGSALGGYLGGSQTAAALGALAMLEKGGPAEDGKPYIVGEKGPELFVPHGSGNVVPFHKIKKAVKSAEKEEPGERSHALARALRIDPNATPSLPAPASGFNPGLFGRAA